MKGTFTTFSPGVGVGRSSLSAPVAPRWELGKELVVNPERCSKEVPSEEARFWKGGGEPAGHFGELPQHVYQRWGEECRMRDLEFTQGQQCTEKRRRQICVERTFA